MSERRRVTIGANARGNVAAGIIALLCCMSGCTTFGAPRSAVVSPGFATSFQLTMTTPVPDEAGWFWSFDCASDCEHIIVAPEVEFTWGLGEPGATPVEVGAGLSGTFPHVDFYAQLDEGGRPFGVGGRVGSTGTWHEFQAYARYDVPTAERTRLLWNPAVFVLTGNSPNGANPGSFVATVQSFGVHAVGNPLSATFGGSIVIGRSVRNSGNRRIGPATAVFGTITVRLTWSRGGNDDRR